MTSLPAAGPGDPRSGDGGGAGAAPRPDAGPRPVRALRLRAHGEAPVLEMVDLRAAGPGEVVVEMAFAGVNPVDRYTAEGRVAADGPLPRTLGGEGAGHCDGRAVLVAGHGLGAARDGLWAARAVVPAAALTPLPDGVDLAEAAALGIAGVTAWRVVHELGGVSGDDRVLVLGAGGGVGSIITSACRALGADVRGQTTNPERADFIAAQGACEVVVCDVDGLLAALAGFAPTVVFDPLGAGWSAVALEALEPFGTLVSFGTSAGATSTVNMQTLYRKALTVLGYGGLIEPEGRLADARRSAVAALAAGGLVVPVGEILPLSSGGAVFERLADRARDGKLVLDLRS